MGVELVCGAVTLGNTGSMDAKSNKREWVSYGIKLTHSLLSLLASTMVKATRGSG
jgi:hypothetical protein